MTRKLLSILMFAWMLCASRVVLAQFSGSLEGLVQDPSGASIPKATVTLTNSATSVTQTTHASDSGVYRFVSLAPGNYVVAASATGFATAKTAFTLTTGQLMNVPLSLPVASSTQTVEVTTQAPVLDTAETRTQLTID